MAKNPENVAKFLSGVAAKLQLLWAKERKVLLDLKQELVRFTFLVDFRGCLYHRQVICIPFSAPKLEKILMGKSILGICGI